MTQKQIDAAKKALPSPVDYKNWTDEQKRLAEELSCREMINSCLTYGSIDDFWEEYEWRFGDKSYATPFVRILGIERVKEIVIEQEKDFSKAKIIHNVYTDSEGVSYNSVLWCD